MIFYLFTIIMIIAMFSCGNNHNFSDYVTHYNDNKNNFDNIKNYFISEYDNLMMSHCKSKGGILQISNRGVTKRGCFPLQQDTLGKIFSLKLFDIVQFIDKNSLEFSLDFIPSNKFMSDEINIYLVYSETDDLTFHYKSMQGRKKKLDIYWWLIEDKNSPF